MSIENSLNHHAPTPNQLEQIVRIRQAGIEFGKTLEELLPSRERALALTNLEQSVMWAVKGIILG